LTGRRIRSCCAPVPTWIQHSPAPSECKAILRAAEEAGRSDGRRWVLRPPKGAWRVGGCDTGSGGQAHVRYSQSESISTREHSTGCGISCPEGIWPGSSTLSLRRALVELARNPPPLRESVCELRSFLRRIHALGLLRSSRHLVDFGPAFERDQNGSLRYCKQTLACSEDTLRINESRPWLTALDCELFVRGWRQGAEWTLREGRIPDRRQSSVRD